MKRNFLLFIFLAFWNVAYGQDLKKEIEDILKNEQTNFPRCTVKNIECAKKIIKLMSKTDKKVRAKWIQASLTNNFLKLIEKMDQFHTNQLKIILSKHGWAMISKFGKEADGEAWLIVQHADHDPFFQAGCAFVLEQLLARGETNQKNFAYLHDRVALKFLHLGMRQKYGTQARFNKGNIQLSPYTGTLDELNKRRNAIGLEPVEQSIKHLKKVYKQ